MKSLIAVAVLYFASLNAIACGPDDFAADVFLWGESAFAGVILSGCAHDAEVKVKVRIVSRHFAPLGSTIVVAHVPAGRMSWFDGSFPPKKMGQAVPLHSQARVLSSRQTKRAVDTANPVTEPIRNADFADLADAGPLDGSD